jgi:hypothetical protein
VFDLDQSSTGRVPLTPQGRSAQPYVIDAAIMVARNGTGGVEEKLTRPWMTLQESGWPVIKSPIERDRTERLQFSLTADELAAVDDFWFQTRMPSRSAAIRELLKRGLIASGILKSTPAASSLRRPS